IPEDWKVCTLGEITDPKRPISYGIVQTGPSVQNGIPCLRVVDIDDGRVNKTDLISTSQTISNAYKRTILQSGDLVMPLRGKVGDVALIDAELAGCNLTRGVAVIALLRDRSAPYCKHFIASSATRTRLVQSMNGSALQEIPIAPLRAFEIALPPTLAEQQAIAEALSDADALIESLEQLLAKKRQIKQGSMQELLSGQKRLPGFSESWEAKSLGDVVQILKGQLITEKAALPGTIPVIAGGKQAAYFHNQSNRIGKTITISGSGASAGYVSFHSYPIFASDCATVSESNDYSIEFIFYWLQLNQDAIYKSQTGGAQPHIHPSDLRPLIVQVPLSIPEQNAIAAVLSDMDAELAALETKLAKARLLKQ